MPQIVTCFDADNVVLALSNAASGDRLLGRDPPRTGLLALRLALGTDRAGLGCEQSVWECPVLDDQAFASVQHVATGPDPTDEARYILGFALHRVGLHVSTTGDMVDAWLGLQALLSCARPRSMNPSSLSTTDTCGLVGS